MPDIQLSNGVLSVSGTYKPGDPRPENGSYNDWLEWSETQHKAGLRQKQCGRCGKWNWPQELSDEVIQSKVTNRHGVEVNLMSPVCKKCRTQ